MDVNDEVKGYLARAVRKGVSVGRVVGMAERAGCEIKSHRNTVEKFLREDGRRLADADDLYSLKRQTHWGRY